MTSASETRRRGTAEQTFSAFETGTEAIGVRNRLLVLPSVICSHIVADRIAAELPGAVSAPHDHGCAQLGADTEQTERTFVGIGTNPNIVSAVVVGLGCEKIQSDDLADRLAAAGVPVRELAIQSVGGSDRAFTGGVEAATDLLEAHREQRTTATLADLTIGIISSDVQDSTVDVADPLVGAFAERVVAAGGRVVVAGTERLTPHTNDVRELIDDSARSEYERVLGEGQHIPARTAGLQRRVADRSVDELTRSWNGLPIEAVLSYGERASHDTGVAFVDAPSQFAEAATALAAAGAHAIVHVTGDGIPIGHPIAPVIKVTGDEATYRSLETDIDVDATRTDVDEFEEIVCDVLDGNPSCAERHGLTQFAITRVGPSM